MNAAILGLLAALAAAASQTRTAPDPHGGRFTTAGRTCERCHAGNNPRAENAYRMARQMSKMVDGLNSGPLSGRPIDCVTCHRVSEGGYVIMQEDRRRFGSVQQIVDHWPGQPNDGAETRRAMARYSVDLGVSCYYCHVFGDWKAGGKPAMQSARDMIAMMREFQKYFELPTTAAVISCFTCHKGAVNIPR